MRGMKFVAAVVATVIAIPPCLAAEDFRDTGRMERRSGAFAGATLRIAMGGSTQTASGAHIGLGVGPSYQRTDARGATQRLQTPGVELRLTSAGKPLMMVGGQDSKSLKQRLGVAGLRGNTLLVVGGIAAAALAVILLTDSDDDGPCQSQPC